MASSIEELVQSAYSFIRSQESNKSIAALTLDHLLQRHIDTIQGGSTRVLLDATGRVAGVRISRLDQLQAIEDGINQVVKALEQAGDDPAKLDALGMLPIQVDTET